MWSRHLPTTNLPSSYYFAYAVSVYGSFKTRVRSRGFVESNPDLVEEAVKYIIFLVDANSLFDTALGMYDFVLVLMIAQHSQKVSEIGYCGRC